MTSSAVNARVSITRWTLPPDSESTRRSSAGHRQARRRRARRRTSRRTVGPVDAEAALRGSGRPSSTRCSSTVEAGDDGVARPGSSGTSIAPARRATIGRAAVDVVAGDVDLARRRAAAGRAPLRAARVCPLPDTPATPTISPARTSKVASLHGHAAVGAAHRDAVDHERRAACRAGRARRAAAARSCRPSARPAPSSVSVDGWSPLTTILPPRSTVTRSAIARVSRQLVRDDHDRRGRPGAAGRSRRAARRPPAGRARSWARRG